MRTNRAVSTIVSTLLIIIVIIVAGLTVYGWGVTALSQQLVAGGTEISITTIDFQPTNRSICLTCHSRQYGASIPSKTITGKFSPGLTTGAHTCYCHEAGRTVIFYNTTTQNDLYPSPRSIRPTECSSCHPWRSDYFHLGSGDSHSTPTKTPDVYGPFFTGDISGYGNPPCSCHQSDGSVYLGCRHCHFLGNESYITTKKPYNLYQNYEGLFPPSQPNGSYWTVTWYNTSTTTPVTFGVRPKPNATSTFPSNFKYNWGTGKVNSWGGNDYYGCKAYNTFNLPTATTITFNCTVDDGVQLRVDGVLKIDSWTTGRKNLKTTLTLPAGLHNLNLTWFEFTGSAYLGFEATPNPFYAFQGFEPKHGLTGIYSDCVSCHTEIHNENECYNCHRWAAAAGPVSCGGNCHYPNGTVNAGSTTHVFSAWDHRKMLHYSSYNATLLNVTRDLYMHSETTSIAVKTYYQALPTQAEDSNTTLTTGSKGSGTFPLSKGTLYSKFVYPLSDISKISAGTWAFYYRGYSTAGTWKFNVDIMVNKSDGTQRTSIATGVALSGALGRTYSTVTGTYSFPDYTVVNPTDYLVINIYAVHTEATASIAYLDIENNMIPISWQTRITNINAQSISDQKDCASCHGLAHGAGTTVYVRNDGVQDAQISKLYINDKEYNFYISYESGVKDGKLSRGETVGLRVIGFPWVSGKRYNFKVATQTGVTVTGRFTSP